MEIKLPAAFHDEGGAFAIFTQGAQKKQDMPNLISTSRRPKRENPPFSLASRAKLERLGKASWRTKKFTNKNLSRGTFLPHVVYPRASSRNNLLFATVHKLLPGLFTIFRMYSQSSTHSHFP
jgi:hypothetical protein